MSIRLRTVNGVRVALCGFETDEQPGDLYLDDGDHYALAAKFNRDYQGRTITAVYPEEWAAMDTQKLRDAVRDFPHADPLKPTCYVCGKERPADWREQMSWRACSDDSRDGIRYFCDASCEALAAQADAEGR